MYKNRLNHNLWIVGWIACAFPLAIASPALYAAEGGSSSYLQGTYGDFATGLLGPKGFYVRNDVIYYDAEVPFRALGSAVDGHVTQAVSGDLLKFAYISDVKIFGGRYNAAIAIPVLFDSKITRHRAGQAPVVAADGAVSGIGDIYFTPVALGWNWGPHHLNANLSLLAPTAHFDEARPLNPGRNYWSFDPSLSYTWLHASRGHEVTVTLGYMMNEENRDTAHRTGNEVHLDWTIAQHFSERLAVGLTGYWYEQATDDTVTLPAGFSAADFDANGVGIGAAVLYSPTIAARHVSVIAKWITDVSAENRLDGDVLLLSVGFKL